RAGCRRLRHACSRATRASLSAVSRSVGVLRCARAGPKAHSKLFLLESSGQLSRSLHVRNPADKNSDTSRFQNREGPQLRALAGSVIVTAVRTTGRTKYENNDY